MYWQNIPFQVPVFELSKTFHLLMPFKKRYLLVLLFIFWMLFIHSNMLTMRTSNEQQRVVFEEKGLKF